MNTRTGAGILGDPRIGRLISISTAGSATNMAVDQAILNAVSQSGIPVLRFYQWVEPTLSLGYFQGLASRSDHCQSDQIRCVRRTTGGGAIVHDRELTYSISMPVPAGQAGPRSALYQQTHAAIASALACFGVHAVPFRLTGTGARSESDNSHFLCFQRRTPEDLIVSGYKVLGSAQRKSRTAVLQHGSLLMHASEYAPQLPGVSDLLSVPITADDLIPGIVANLSECLGVDWQAGHLSEQEKLDAEQISCERFSQSGWTARR